MNLDWFLRAFPNIAVTNEQIACCRYLERKGLRFLIDFGYENATAIVWNELDMEAAGVN